MWTPPNLENRWRSSSDGWNTPLGWEWTVPTTLKSGGMFHSWKIACRFPPTVPGIRRSSVITPASARRIAPNSFGYASLDAARIIRRVLRRIAVGRWNMGIGSRLRELLLDPLVEVVPEADEPRGPLARGELEPLVALEGDLPLPVEHEQALLRPREPHGDAALRREHERPEVRRERRDRGDDDRVHPRVHDRPADGHRVRGRARGGRDDHAVRPHAGRDLSVDADLERANLRDVSGVEDGLVQAVRETPAVQGARDPHAGLDPVVAVEDPGQERIDLARHDLREEAEGAAVDPEHVSLRDLERPQDRPVPAHREDGVEPCVLERRPLLLQRVGDLLLEGDLVRLANRLQDVAAQLRGPRDLRVRGDADPHGSISRICSSPNAIKFVRALGLRSMSRGLRSRPTTPPPASRTMRTPAATSIARNSWPTSAL